jgi:hypothetical protein
MRGYYGLVLRWPGRERFLLIRIHGGKRRLAVLSLLKRRSAELLAVILSYEAPDFAAKPVSSSCCFSVITGYQRRVRLAPR